MCIGVTDKRLKTEKSGQIFEGPYVFLQINLIFFQKAIENSHLTISKNKGPPSRDSDCKDSNSLVYYSTSKQQVSPDSNITTVTTEDLFYVLLNFCECNAPFARIRIIVFCPFPASVTLPLNSPSLITLLALTTSVWGTGMAKGISMVQSIRV